MASIDQGRVALAFLTGLLPGGRLVRSAAEAWYDVYLYLLDAEAQCMDVEAEDVLARFLWGIGREYVLDYVADKVVELGFDAVRSGLQRLGWWDEAAEDILKNANEGICFEVGTLIATQTGTVSIETIKVGDLVWTMDPTNGAIALYPVTEVFSHPVSSLLEVLIAGKSIRVTEEHPFWVVGKGWIGAASLSPGDCGLTRDGICQQVNSITVVTTDTWVYNFTVGHAHTYFVGEGQWLVHNECYRRGGRTAQNLTPRMKDVSSGLSLSTTPQKGWKINATPQELQALGFIVTPDPMPDDPGHFLLKPGPKYEQKGWTLLNWAMTRDTITDDPSTWHPLTRILFDLAESYSPPK